MDKVKYAVYDCQICGKEHELKATWTDDAEIALKKEWKLSIEEEIVDNLLAEANRELGSLHGEGSIFIPERLGFSLV